MASLSSTPSGIKREASPCIKDEGGQSSKLSRQKSIQQPESSSSRADSIYTWLQELPTNSMAPMANSQIRTIGKKREFAGNQEDGPEAAQKRKISVTTFAKPLTPPVSDPSHPTATTPTESTSKTSSNRCGKPNYRAEQLKHHGVWVDPQGLKLPAEVLQFVRRITRKQRDSAGPSSEEWLESREILSEFQACNESDVQESLLYETLLFPSHRNYKGKDREILIWKGTDVKFNATSVPRKPNKPALVAPKPDRFYGYTPAPFESTQSATQKSLLPVMERYELAHYAKPSTSICLWPFLIIEFKSLSGNTLAAENQNAGTGAASVNSLQTLFRLAYPGQARPVTDSLIFSCVVNPGGAGVWIHWRMSNSDPVEEGSPPFFSAQVEFYSFRDEEHLKAFRACLLNIMDWALGEHLTIIKDALIAFEDLDAAAPNSISRQEKEGEEEDEKEKEKENGIETNSVKS